MKSPTTIFGLIAACGLALSGGANVFDPHETLPDWIWPMCKMITAVGVAGGFYFASDKSKKPEPEEKKPEGG